jgi:MFS transporter, FSR family, fosmidomycin resistance protein
MRARPDPEAASAELTKDGVAPGLQTAKKQRVTGTDMAVAATGTAEVTQRTDVTVGPETRARAAAKPSAAADGAEAMTTASPAGAPVEARDAGGPRDTGEGIEALDPRAVEPQDAVEASAVQPKASTSGPERIRSQVKLIGLLALGHLVVDANQGSLPALLPFLKAAHNLSYAAVGAIVLMANLTSSIIQPLFGYLSDRTARRWLLPVAVFLSGLGLALTGLAPGYPAILALVLITGFGVAAYHPEGYKTATSVAGARKATALSWFSLGGNIGIAVGPALITALITGFGLGGSLGMLVPSALVSLLLLAALSQVSEETAAKRAAATTALARNMPGAMALLILVVTLRSWSQLGFTTFVPLYYVDHLQADPRLVGPLLFVFLGAGALGTVVAGPIADRVGARPFMVWVFLLATPFAVAFLLVRGWAAFLMLGAVGFVLVSTFTVSVVLGQAYLPRSTGMASGLIVGFAIGTGGLGVTLLGWVADHWSLPVALWISAVMPLAGFLAALGLPEPARR